MESTSATIPIPDREIFYQRARTQNRIFEKMTTFFAERAEATGVTKRQIAQRLNRDPAQITRWLSNPSNLTLDTISDLLLALEAEMDVTMHLFEERPALNSVHPWMAEYWQQERGSKMSIPMPQGNANSGSFGLLQSPAAAQMSTTSGSVVQKLENAKR